MMCISILCFCQYHHHFSTLTTAICGSLNFSAVNIRCVNIQCEFIRDMSHIGTQIMYWLGMPSGCLWSSDTILLISASLLVIFFFIYWHKSNPFLNRKKGVISGVELFTLSAIVVMPWFWITKLYCSFISMPRGGKKHTLFNIRVNGKPGKARVGNTRKHTLPAFFLVYPQRII